MVTPATKTSIRIAVTGGGTGGHVYPALAVIAALAEPQLLYIGTRKGIEANLVQRQGLPFTAIAAGAFRGRSPLRLLLNLGLMKWGFIQSVFALRRFQPHVVLATGGYVCVPVVLAAWALKVPSLIYLPDVEPGWAVRFLSKFATKIAATSGKSARFLPAEKAVETGYPVRPGFAQVSKAAAKEQLGLDETLKTLLVWGGSRGARSINVAISKILPELLERCQIIHLSGPEDEPGLQEMRSSLPEKKRQRYFLHSYLHEQFPLAIAAADLAVSRAGASVMGEFPAAALPSILVPYPHAGGHQRQNAAFLAEQGAAIVVEESNLNEQLLSTIGNLITSDEVLGEMAEKARQLARPEAAQSIASLLAELGQKKASKKRANSLQEVPWEVR